MVMSWFNSFLFLYPTYSIMRSDSKVMRLIFFWKYCSPLTQPAIDLLPSSIPNCSGMALQWFIVEWMPDVSRRVCEPRHENGSNGTSCSGMPSFFVLHSVTVPPQHMINFSGPLEMMQCQKHKPFAGTKCFLKAETLLTMSSAADDHQQDGQVKTQHEYENLFNPIEDWQSAWLLMKWTRTGKLFVGY